MPSSNSIASSVDIKALRRSPRLLAPTAPPGQHECPSTRRSLRFLQKKDISPPTLPEPRRSHSAIRQVHPSLTCLSPSKNVSPKTPKPVLVNTPKKLKKPSVVSSENKDSNSGSKKSETFGNGFEGIQTPRRSSRLSCVPKIDNACEGKNAEVSKSSINFGGRSRDFKHSNAGSKRDSTFENGLEGIQTPRRSSRLSHAPKSDNALERKNAEVSKSKITFGGRSRELKHSNVGSKKSSALEDGFGGIQTPRRSSRLSYAQKIDSALERKNSKVSKSSSAFEGRSRDLKHSNTGSKESSTFENRFEGIQITRRSSRLSYAPKIDNALDGKDAKVSKSSITFGGRSRDLKHSNTGSKKSSTFEDGFEGIQTPRRSSRLSCASKIDNVHEGKNPKVSKSSITFERHSKDLKHSNTGSRKSSTFENGIERMQTPRRSSRLSYASKIDNALDGKNTKVSKSSITFGGRSKDLKHPRVNNEVEGHQSIVKPQIVLGQQDALEKSSRKRERSRSSDKKTVLLNVQNVVTRESSHEENVVEGGERRKGNSADHESIATEGGGTEVVGGEMEKKSVAIRKRKREDGVVGIRQGWTKEQEAALQRAYYAAKPTPQFWKKVSKLVPGKSAQDCFDKVHSDHLTPPQPRPRSRTQSSKSCQIELSSLSEDKLLNPNGAKSRKPIRKTQRSQNAQKTVRYLLEKKFQRAVSSEADLFSQLEPNANCSNHSPLPSKQLSITKDLQGNQGFLHERSLSNHKKPLSRFSSSVERVVSPPVLKQVKNKALHEKYIDQLHCREAKRKSVAKCTKKCISEEKGLKEVHAERTNDLRDAKNALISDARDAIHQLQHLQANGMNDSPDFDDDLYDNVYSENEDEI
ncbi:hypothetical protein SDJN03_11475, partial [Cucurbita argyrosperma subsp. sororia]